MRDPQIYMTALCLAAGLIATRAWRVVYPPALAGLLFPLLGLVLHFKRGAWIAAGAGLMVMAMASRRGWLIGLVALLGTGLAAMPQTRERIEQIAEEFDGKRGGRMVLWREVGPALIQEHPMGMGWKAVRHQDFIAINPEVEKGLNHLHNNLLQVRLELGWAGVTVWALWMAAMWLLLLRAYRRAPPGDATFRGLALGGLGALTALLANGMVEYNFGDSEIFMLWVMLMGIAGGLHARWAEARGAS